jgi:hypothetical protein
VAAHRGGCGREPKGRPVTSSPARSAARLPRRAEASGRGRAARPGHRAARAGGGSLLFMGARAQVAAPSWSPGLARHGHGAGPGWALAGLAAGPEQTGLGGWNGPRCGPAGSWAAE